MSSPRPSSAVLVTRGNPRNPEIYLIQRSPELRFLGGYWAFPGGVVDRMDDGEEGKIDELTGRRCAVRELFEETGILPAPLARLLDEGERATLRAALLTRGSHVERWVDLLRRTPEATEAVRPFCRLITPPFSRLRYATEFHHLELPAGEEPSYARGELVDGGFRHAEEVITAWTRGEVLVSPPTLLKLRLQQGLPLEQWLATCGRHCDRLLAGHLESVWQSPGLLAMPLLTPTQPPGISTNCYLVGNRDVWIVDPAPIDPGQRTLLLEIIDEWCEQGHRLAGILLTHHHPDHVGFVEELAAHYTLAVHAHPWTLEHLPFRPREVHATDEGDEIELGEAPDGTPDWKLRVLHTPGHAPGHLVFIDSRYRSAIVGDMLATGSTIAIDPPEGHLATYLASLQRLLGEEIGTLHPAHGIQYHDGPELIERYLTHRRAREEKVRRALGEKPRRIEEMVSEVYDDTPVEAHALAARSLLAGLIKLAEDGVAEESGGGWRRVRS